jgi:hypothetical protein
MSHIKGEKGISLIIVIMSVSVVLGIALGVSSILVTQIEMLRDVGYSVVAFYAADTGIEKVLLLSTPDDIAGDIGDATFTVQVLAGGEGTCSADNYCIKSIGAYQSASRAIEIVY